MTPIAVSLGEDPRFSLCKLNFEQYSAAPHSTPMFKDLLAISNCVSGQHATLSALTQQTIEAKGTPAGRIVYPSGFIFHESRVGSTLVANLLGSDPFNMVFSESAIPAEILLRCRDCSHEKHVEVFRSTVLMIGRSPIHKRLFFKFQSITSTAMKIVLEAFPDVPWAFLFRNPVQTMMSHLDPKKGGGRSAPCLRSRSRPSEKVKEAMRRAGATSSAPNAAWCAAHLNMLCEHAFEAFEEFSHYTHQSVAAHRKAQAEGHFKLNGDEITTLVDSAAQRGFLVDYATLPGLLPRLLLQAFGVPPSPAWVAQMEYESQQYSKGARRNSKAGVFSGDSEDKEKRATEEIEKWAQAILLPTTAKLLTASRDSVESVRSKLGVALPLTTAGEVDWETVKTIPAVPRTKVASAPQRKRSMRFDPFGRDHNSSSFEEPDCPPVPPPDYPKTYAMKTLLDNWNPDVTVIPPVHYNALCRINYQTDYEKALAYRNAEVPFIVYGHPEVDAVVEKWRDVDYLNKKAGSLATYKTETSPDNHFMYWKHTSAEDRFKDREGNAWTPPTGHVSMTFGEWLEKAVRGHNTSLEERDHFYFRMSSSDPSSWIFQELPFFQPKKSFFMVEPAQQRGIHCRFGNVSTPCLPVLVPSLFSHPSLPSPPHRDEVSHRGVSFRWKSKLCRELWRAEEMDPSPPEPVPQPLLAPARPPVWSPQRDRLVSTRLRFASKLRHRSSERSDCAARRGEPRLPPCLLVCLPPLILSTGALHPHLLVPLHRLAECELPMQHSLWRHWREHQPHQAVWLLAQRKVRRERQTEEGGGGESDEGRREQREWLTGGDN
jgi:hypothetical protein